MEPTIEQLRDVIWFLFCLLLAAVGLGWDRQKDKPKDAPRDGDRHGGARR